jgi:hypothetical protein
MTDAMNANSNRSSPLAMLAAVMVAAAGCGPHIPPLPATEPVHGNVTLDGQPVTNGFVRFLPETGSGGRFAEGMITEDGSYTVAAFKGKAGTLPGEYKVYFSGQPQAAEEDHDEAPPPDVPKKYLRPETSDLKVTVSGGDNDIPLELHGEVEEAEGGASE